LDPDNVSERPANASTALVSLTRVEYQSHALGIGVAAPRLSWITTTAAEGWTQAAYEIEAYDAKGERVAGTGRVEAGQSVLALWPFAPLRSRERLAVRVRVWGSDGSASAWSGLVWVETGLLSPSDWTAQFITPTYPEDTSRPQPAAYFRREFDVRATVRSARLYITSLGVYEPYLNGHVVGDHVLAPGWTSYHHRLRYQIFDVTEHLAVGRNAIGAIVGEGWYRGRLGFGGGRRNVYGERLGLLAQLEVEYADGTSERLVTDTAWRAATGPILSSELYDGEVYDARLEQPGWAAPGYDDNDWAPVEALAWDLGRLAVPPGPPVRRTAVVEPVSVSRLPSGRLLLDFGQNLVGRLRIAVQGAAGHTVTLRHAEVLENGELAARPLRRARATDTYILRGQGLEQWEPRFTFHGFRYAEMDGWPGELKPGAIRAVVCHSDLERIGWFECSDPLVNQFHENVVWSMRGNFLDIPTDCPQRDERLGWTGDIQVFAPTACYLFDSAGFLASWLADLAAEQRAAGGNVPFFVPNLLPGPALPAAAWGDAAVIVPWVLYQRYGDAGILETQFDSMQAWVENIAGIAGSSRLWNTGMQFGDWLDPQAPPDKPGRARCAPEIVATAYFARSAELLGRAAAALGRAAEAETYQALAAEIRASFCDEYLTPTARLMSDAPTAYALALEFALLPGENERQQAGRRLLALVRQDGYHISTGFVGTPLICDALCAAGETEAAYRLLLQRECPSWLYPVTMGATTIWERWDSLLPDGSVNPGEMTSFNHYALGAVADWLHRVVGGLAPAEPGYRRLLIRPQPGGGLTSARARLCTPCGPAECAWHIEADVITVEVEVPANAAADVYLPGRAGDPLRVGSGRYRWAYPWQGQGSERATLSLDSHLDDIADDREAYAAVIRVLTEHNPEFADRARQTAGVSLRQLALLNPRSGDLLARLEAALANGRRPAG
jgi:alpha-L-rhamnosidase